MKQTKITFNMAGMERFQKAMSEYRARVGIIGGEGAREDDSDMTNAEIALLQIFGSISANIPPRDFLIMPIETHKREITKMMSGTMVQTALETGNFKQIYKLLGAAAETFVQQAFETRGFGQWPPNAPLTIARKGSSQPLIDTGEMRRAVASDVVRKADMTENSL